jgi:CubicO group peptidase (beta-lactamase class C family)
MRTILLLGCCLALTRVAYSQADTHAILTHNVAVTATIGEGETRSYVLQLDAGQFVYGEATQHDVDVSVTVYDPSGNVADRFDASSRGAEPMQLETHIDGEYRFDVTAAEEQSGHYSLVIERIESADTDPVRRLDQLLSQFAGDDVPGAIVAVVKDGEIVHSQSVGMANLTHDVPFERNTVSNVGSVSKQFTAFAITQLAYLGEISLEDDVREYFPELPDLGQTVTVRHLLNHTSGYREFLNLLGMSGRGIGEGDYIDRDELLLILQHQPELQEPPGTKFNYNNTAYGLAAMLVERVTEIPFPEWMAENVFQPVGMTDSRIRSHLGEVVPNAADGYVYAEQSAFRQAGDLGGGGGSVMGAGAVYSTVDDLARWMNNLHTARVGGAEVIGEMTSPQIEVPGEGNSYGFGLSLGEHRGLTTVSHGGADIAHRAMLIYYPKINAGVIALSNNGAFSGDIAWQTAEAFFAEHMQPEEAPLQLASNAGDTDKESKIDPSVFEPHLGKYELDDYPGVVISVSADQGQIFVQSPGDDPLQVTPMSATVLKVPPDQSIEFRLNAEGHADSLILSGTDALRASRLANWEPETDDLRKYVGRYFSTELETFYNVELRDDALLITHRRLDDIMLTPKVEDSFNATFPVTEVTFSRDNGDEVSGMSVSNIRTQNVRFDRQQ